VNEDADYPLVTTIKKTGEMPHPRTTRAAQAIIQAREEAAAKVISTEYNLYSICRNAVYIHMI